MPNLNTQAFNCPHCGVYSKHQWTHKVTFYYTYRAPNNTEHNGTFDGTNQIAGSKCDNCSKLTIWYQTSMIYPQKGNVEIANQDLPSDILELYNEAGSVINHSPKSAAALLRLSLQRLCKHLGEKGKNINDDIKSLVKKGLPIQVQQALDIVRVTGNYAVHPGEINFNDQPEHSIALFGLINFIALHFITQPKMVANIYSALPEKDRINIANRDKKN
ncbi:MAG: DUF4145 domain-containing protein [Chitinophagales bacterium]